MKKFSFYIGIIFLLGIFSSGEIFSQPKISYLLPDIGAPGMNTYVEIIAPYDANGTFGADGFYLNNSNDIVRVEFERISDYENLVLGPLVVSWNGRLISMQIFVKPDVQPNSWEWDKLTPEFRVPIRVFANGQYSNVDTFYVVQPFQFGDKSALGENALGQGSLGKRSRRGAMIVDSMIVGGKNYIVSNNDCDNSTTGNQGYLPFVLMSKGKITTASGTATIDISGGGVNAGPGGGGGGGQFCDFSTNTGSRGGNGYTGGGSGGRNTANMFQNPGEGSGSSGTTPIGGKSLNNVPGGATSAYESAGGGTGHPFGVSGTGWGGGGSPTPDGQYGAGSGGNQAKSGGGGAYATAGQSGDGNNGGKVIGNAAIVPFAGGSGGGSGNPQGLSNCAGIGGGAGGAITIYGANMSNISILANGANAGISLQNGGSGAGGGVALTSKLGLQNLTANALGGTNGADGGDGRIRIDAPGSIPTTSPVTGFSGPTTDTSSIRPRTFTLTGTGNGSQQKIYLKPESSDWAEYATVSGNSWSQQIILTGTDSLYFIAVTQKNSTTSIPPYQYEPAWVFSQAAANIIQPRKEPIINPSHTQKILRVLSCGKAIKDTVMIRNIGKADLRVSKPFFFSSKDTSSKISGLALRIPAQWPYSIAYKGKPFEVDSVPFVIEFERPATGGPIFRDTLFIPSNDPDPGRDTIKIFYEITMDTLSAGFFSSDGKTVLSNGTIDLGKICLGAGAKDTVIGIKNLSPKFVTVIPFLQKETDFRLDWLSGASVAPDSTGRIRIRLTPNKKGFFFDSVEVRLTAENCEITKKIRVQAEVISLVLAVDAAPHGGQYGNINIGASKQLSYKITNDGSGTATINNFPILDPHFRIISPTLPIILKPGENATIVIEFTPDAERTETTVLKFQFVATGICSDSTKEILLAGTGVRGALSLSKSLIDFGSVPKCDQPLLDSVSITNTGTGSIAITQSAFINQGASTEFTIISQPAAPYTLQSGQSAKYFVQYSPAASTPGGMLNASLEIPNSGIPNVLSIPITVKSISLDVTVDPQPAVNFGSVGVGQSSTPQAVTITNNGTTEVTISSAVVGKAQFSVNPQNVVIPPGESRQFTLIFTPSSLGTIEDSLKINFSSPCSETRIVLLEGNGISGNIIPDKSKLDFGRLVSCQSEIDSVIIYNIGNDKVVLLDGSISGTDAALFSFVNSVSYSGLTLNPGDSIVQLIRFDPAGSSTGKKNAVYTVRFEGIGGELPIPLEGFPVEPILVSPSTKVNVGEIEVGLTNTQRITIQNDNPEDIQISTMPVLISGATVFSLSLETPQSLPITLKSGQSLNFLVEFAPKDTGLFIDTVVIRSQPCDISTQIEVYGRGVRKSLSKVWLPNVTALVTDKSIRVPVYIQLQSGTVALDNVKLSATVYSNGNIFYPYALSKGKILSNKISSGLSEFSFEVDGLIVSPDSSIATEIIGAALIGDEVSTPLIISKVTILRSGSAQDADTANGILTLTGICEDGGVRLISRSQPANIVVVPNPLTQQGEIQARMQEAGDHILQIFSSEGSKISEEKFSANAGQTKIFPVNSAQYSNGLYQLVLITPTRTVTGQMLISK